MFLIEYDLTSIIIASVKNVFETMIFMDLEEQAALDYDRLKKGQIVSGTIRMEGKCSGKVAVYCTKEMAQTITANLLGVDEEDEEVASHLNDSIGEVSNMIAGSIETRLSPDKDICDLFPPKVEVVNDLSAIDFNDSKSIVIPFFSEDNYLWVEARIFWEQ